MRPGLPAWLPALAMVGVLLLFAGLFQDTRSLWMPDEQRYGNIALEMLRSGDWLHPVIHHEHPHYAKPPLTYWVLATSMGLFGRHEWAMRLPNTLAFVITALLAGALVRRLWALPVYAGVAVYATMLLPYAAASIVTTDTLLTLFVTLSLYAFVRWWWSPNPSQRDLLLMWLAMGLAFLAKGPPALLLPLAMFLFAVRERGLRILPALAPASGLLLFAVSGLGWYAMLFVDDPAAFVALFHDEVVQRIFTGAHHKNPGVAGALLVYLPTVVLGGLPWTALAIPACWRRARDGTVSAPVTRLLGWCLLLPLAVFVLSQSRLPFYLLPLAVPLAVLVTPFIAPRLATAGGRVVLLACLLILPATRALVATQLPVHDDPRAIAQSILQVTPFAIREVVIVEGRRLQGLSFYLDAEVEVIALLPWPGVESSADDALEYRDDLAQELSEQETGQVYVVDREIEPVFLEQIRSLGRDAMKLGEDGERRFFALRREQGLSDLP